MLQRPPRSLSRSVTLLTQVVLKLRWLWFFRWILVGDCTVVDLYIRFHDLNEKGSCGQCVGWDPVFCHSSLLDSQFCTVLTTPRFVITDYYVTKLLVFWLALLLKWKVADVPFSGLQQFKARKSSWHSKKFVWFCDSVMFVLFESDIWLRQLENLKTWKHLTAAGPSAPLH